MLSFRRHAPRPQVIPMDAAEIRDHDLPRDGGGVLAISQSGETKDVHRAVVTAQKVTRRGGKGLCAVVLRSRRCSAGIAPRGVPAATVLRRPLPPHATRLPRVSLLSLNLALSLSLPPVAVLTADVLLGFVSSSSSPPPPPPLPQEGIPTISVVNAVGSLIARTTQLGVYCHAGRESAVASTKAFTTQVTCLALLACWFRQLRDATAAEARADAAQGKASGKDGSPAASARPLGRESTASLAVLLRT